MDGGNADSDHSMTWEDFFGSTTDLTPTLIGIYDSLMEPNSGPEASNFDLNAKDARNDPPLEPKPEETEPAMKETEKPKVKLPINKSSLYTMRSKISEADTVVSEVSETFLHKSYKSHLKSFKNDKVSDITTTPHAFDNLSPNVKRMISTADTSATGLKFQKKTTSSIRSSLRHKSNIPLVGATSKISQSGVEILSSVDIYDQPSGLKTKHSEVPIEVPPKTFKAEFRFEPATYDVPTNKAIYDVPSTNNKTAFESLSLPYIDQSIELSITTDREFDTKLSSKENSPDKPQIISPNADGTNSLHRKDFVKECTKPAYLDTIGSTGNLKCVPIKDVRLQPPEVPRPLSMSSIASSSSTSSSGVQHKGGVNSAYLASIESLDDHSDADIASAIGSNNFVNNAGMTSIAEERRAEAIPKFHHTLDELSGLSQLERVCAEIVQTENVYVEDLRQVVEGYQHVWRKGLVFSEEELVDLFNNIEDIYAFNRSLCEELNTCRLEAISIAKCFVDHNTGFTVYTSYCTGYPRTMERLAVLASRPHSARIFRERQVALGHPLPLASYLLKPVQRILKYHLLLQNVVKLCACRDTEFALLKMTSIAQHIDDMKRKHEHSVRVQEIQSLLYGWVGPDLTTYGELCAEGTFRVFGAKAVRHVFLFDKMLLITKNREDGILAYKSHIMCNNMMLVEAIAGAPLSFHVIPWDCPRAQVTLQATSQRHKREWTLLLKRVILENYNAVIPSHARQLVMELGQNKTDDDILAEKSHNLITQASMRKQLSAPEYLEKRKLERERRKSFENGVRGRLKKNRKLTMPIVRRDIQCDCAQVSIEKGQDVTCDNCYVDLCSDCETELNKDKIEDKCSCKNDDNFEKCPECDRYLHYIDAGSAEHLERKLSCKCSDFKSSQESVGKEFTLNKNRGYHSSDNIVGYTENKELTDTNNSCSNIRLQKTCLKCAKIKENIVVTDSNSTIHSRKSRFNDMDKRSDTLRSKSKDDPQRSKLSKIGTWRRKSEPGLPQNAVIITPKRSLDSDSERPDLQGGEKIEFECRNCGSNKITKKVRNSDGVIISDPELDKTRTKPSVEIKMYNSKNIPKKISKLKKNRAKSMRHGPDTTAKFYADLSTDVSTENILHISESTDSLNAVAVENKEPANKLLVPSQISKDEDIDEETYKKLIEKTDSFKKNELEKVKYLNKQNVIKEGTEIETETANKDVTDKTEEPLEQIISQLLMQNREFQKLLKKQQLRNTAQRRHQRLLKSHSNPEPTTSRSNDLTKIKPKFGRQTSENLERKPFGDKIVITLSPQNEEQDSEDDHIYETLRVIKTITPTVTQSMETNINRAESPINRLEHSLNVNAPESDYVYLSFDQLHKLKDNDEDGIYDVPVKRIEKPENRTTDYYVAVESRGPRPDLTIINEYDNLIELRKRQKEPTTVDSDYLPMNADQGPNTPEIWLSRQKEHFNVSRDRKSGSLPRSFQVVTSTSEENNLSTFRSKPNANNKTYLNRDGKVLSTDRPFTIASDKSDLSFDDIENYMSDGDILKFNKNNSKQKLNEKSNIHNISQSTLELEEEIDRCYKNNFEKINLDANKNENLLTVSQSNLMISATSSCEALMVEKIAETDIEIIHPEHKIYKPTSNMLSLKNVLSRFKNKNTKVTLDTSIEVNSNDPSSPDSTSSDLKSPTSEKRPGLNPRSYSKNLLQRFRNIIGDEQTDDSSNKNERLSPIKSKIKVVVTSTDVSPLSTSIVYNDPLSKSVCNSTTLSESQSEKNNLEILSHSCDDINRQKAEAVRPQYEKSISMVSSIASTLSPSKSNTSSYQSLNKLPIYMQGSKNLGARIAQSDYVDPSTLISDKSANKNVNVLINKNAVRPDSLFSNSSFVTSSSEGAYQMPRVDRKPVEEVINIDLDENIYEKSFEKIEQVTDEDVFRDSAVYSDQDDDPVKEKQIKNEVVRVESVKRSSSFKKYETVTVTSSFRENKRIVVTGSRIQVDKMKEQRSQVNNNRSKIAPPVPAKPKLPETQKQNIPIPNTITKTTYKDNSNEVTKTNTIKRNTSIKQSYSRSESTPPQITKPKNTETNKPEKPSEIPPKSETNKANTNIHIKRLSFERASLDSATRKTKVASEHIETKRSSTEVPKSTSKSVLERRMEIESLSKSNKPIAVKKPSQIAKPVSITTKMASFERSSELKPTTSTEMNIPSINDCAKESDECKASWVKQVVNKFQ